MGCGTSTSVTEPPPQQRETHLPESDSEVRFMRRMTIETKRRQTLSINPLAEDAGQAEASSPEERLSSIPGGGGMFLPTPFGASLSVDNRPDATSFNNRTASSFVTSGETSTGRLGSNAHDGVVAVPPTHLPESDSEVRAMRKRQSVVAPVAEVR